MHFQNSEEPPEAQQNPTRKWPSPPCGVEILSSSLFAEGDDDGAVRIKLLNPTNLYIFFVFLHRNEKITTTGDEKKIKQLQRKVLRQEKTIKGLYRLR